MRAIVAGFSMTGLLIFGIICATKWPLTIWLFVSLFAAILIICATTAGKQSDERSYSWNLQGQRPDTPTR